VNAAGSAKPKGRSPSYPSITLQKAIERAGQLFKVERQYPTAVEAVVRHWGYAGVTGPAGMTVAALKKYGLAEDEGSKSERKLRLTDLAVQILNHPDPEARAAAIREAALMPAIHREMWDRYGAELPSDGNLMWMLQREDSFTETGAQEFIRQYRSTVDFANLTQAGSDQPTESRQDDDGSGSFSDDEPKQQSEVMTRALEARAAGEKRSRESALREAKGDFGMGATSDATSVAIPLPSGGSIIVQAVLPLSEANWIYFTAVLGAMKPGFTGDKSMPRARPDGSSGGD